jgi:oxalate decarboxylase/phosphoglucose isomerase-like protein (cupin superfamily)
VPSGLSLVAHRHDRNHRPHSLRLLHFNSLSGTGANTVEGKTAAKGVGSVIYEPFSLVHQWGNPGDEPLRFLAFNISPEGVPAVVPGAPLKAQ